MSSQQQSEVRSFWKAVISTFVALTALTGVNIFIIMGQTDAAAFKPSQRNVASVDSAKEKVDPLKVAPIIEIDCTQKREEIKLNTRASSARLFFKNCEKLGSVLNQSNKSQGHFFLLKKDHWTSDYLSLKEGKNQLVASLADGDQVIEITREKIKPTTKNKDL